MSYDTIQRRKPSLLEEHHTIFPILMLYVGEQFANYTKEHPTSD